MTKKQEQQFNIMLGALRCIAGHRKAPTTFMTPDQLRKSKEANFMGFEEVIEMAYENMQGMAKDAINGVKPIVVNQSKAQPNQPPK